MNYLKLSYITIIRYVVIYNSTYASVVKFVSSKLNFANNSNNTRLVKLLIPRKDYGDV
jgi:hypothetical protein